jgi:hypothetical protein
MSLLLGSSALAPEANPGSPGPWRTAGCPGPWRTAGCPGPWRTAGCPCCRRSDTPRSSPACGRQILLNCVHIIELLANDLITLLFFLFLPGKFKYLQVFIKSQLTLQLP